MHRGLFGTGGQILPFYEQVWDLLAKPLHLKGEYPPERWSSGFLLRNAFLVYAAGYGILLLTLRQFRWGRAVSLKTLLLLAVAVGLPFILMPYLMSSDLFDYTSFARLWVKYHTSPYVSTISEFPDDLFFPVTCWKMGTSVYGPAYTLFSFALIWISGLFGSASQLPAVLAHKISMFGFQLAAGALVWTILDRAGARDRAFKTALFLFNPLVMLEFPGNGHNEAMMIAFLMGGLALAQRNRWAQATLVFTLAVQTKLYCLPVFALYVCYRCWKAPTPVDAAKRAFAMGGLFAVASALLYLPFGLNAATVLAPVLGPGGNSMTKSLGDYLAYKAPIHLNTLPVVGVLFAGNQPTDVRRFGLLSTFVVCVLGAFHARSLSRAAAAMAFFMLWWCNIGATWFMEWYVTAAVAMASVAPSRRIALSSICLSFTVFSIYLLECYGFSNDGDIHNWAVAHFEIIVFLPPIGVFLLATVADWFVARKRSVTLHQNLSRAGTPA